MATHLFFSVLVSESFEILSPAPVNYIYLYNADTPEKYFLEKECRSEVAFLQRPVCYYIFQYLCEKRFYWSYPYLSLQISAFLIVMNFHKKYW